MSEATRICRAKNALYVVSFHYNKDDNYHAIVAGYKDIKKAYRVARFLTKGPDLIYEVEAVFYE